MVSDEQKKIWQQEKNQQIQDKKNQPKQIVKTQKKLKFGGKQPAPQPGRPASVKKREAGNPQEDQILRNQLGI